MEFTDSVELTKALLLIALVTGCAAVDLCTRRIPNSLLFPVLMTSLFLGSLTGGLPGLVDSLAGLVIGLLMLMPLHVLGRMGAGDVKLLGVVGSVLGAWGAVVAGLATMMAGGILGVLYIMWIAVKSSAVSTISPFVHQIKEAGASGEAMTWEMARATEIPYAVAIAVGTLAAVLYLDLLSGGGIA